MAKQDLSGVRVLVVEDEYLIAHDTCMWLKDAGAQVVGPVPNAAQAVELMRSSLVDVAVVDINLGTGPDFDLASHLRQRLVPFIFATGYGNQSIPPEFAAVPRLEKPFSDTQLLREVRQLF